MHDMGGTPWENRENYEKWDPSAFVSEWATPQLIIHSELDYRLPISEGLAAFNALQTRGVPSRFLTFPDENHVSVPFPLYVPMVLITPLSRSLGKFSFDTRGKKDADSPYTNSVFSYIVGLEARELTRVA